LNFASTTVEVESHACPLTDNLSFFRYYLEKYHNYIGGSNMLTYLEKGWVKGQPAAVEAYALQCLIMRKGQAETVL
jgi:hypothetical protein